MINSMTAFARHSEHGDWGQVTWEMRSVNHRYLDVSFKLPEDWRVLEMPLREALQKRLKRGKIEVKMSFKPGERDAGTIKVNQALAQQLISAHATLTTLLPDSDDLRAQDLMRWPGVIEVDEVNSEMLKLPLLNAFNHALEQLIEVRQREGAQLSSVMLAQLEGVETEVEKIVQRVPQWREQHEQKLSKAIEKLNVDVDEQRLAQEVAILAQKSDITEELDRLKVHTKEMRHILAQGGVVGRRLDFLMQEFNREANTTASKSIEPEVTKSAVEMKVYIEQMREQIQNIE